MNDIEYIENLKDIIDTYFDGSQSKFARFIGTSSPTVSRILNRTTKISDSLKGAIYDRLQLIKGLPKEILSEFEPTTDDIITEVSVIEQEEILVNNILQQIRNNRKINLTPNNPNSIYDLYTVLYEEINRLQYSAGAIINYDMLHLFICNFLNSAKAEISKYIFANKYTPFKMSLFFQEILSCDVSNNIYDIDITKYKKHGIMSFKVIITNNSLFPILSKGNIVIIECNTDKNENRYHNEISLCKINDLMFFALVEVEESILANSDIPITQNTFENFTTLTIQKGNSTTGAKDVVLNSKDIQEFQIDVIGKVRVLNY